MNKNSTSLSWFPLLTHHKISSSNFVFYLATYIFFLVWGLRLMGMDLRSAEIYTSFMHNINIPFHETGHVLFSPFGTFLHFLGGSLMQLIVPTNDDAFAASIALWWLGESFMDLAPYINDARFMAIPLIGGEASQHDWNYLLRELGWLNAHDSLGALAGFIGRALLILSLVWEGILLSSNHKKT